MSLDEFQRLSGLHFSYVSAVERGRRNPTLNSILLIARGLGVDAAELVRNLPEGEPPRKRAYRPPPDRRR